MTSLFLLLIGLSQGPGPSEAAGPVSVELEVRAALPNQESKVIGSTRLTDVRKPEVLYVYAPRTFCEGISFSSEKPASAAYGWSVEVIPTVGTPNAAVIRWTRLWINPGANRRMGARGLRLDDPSWASRSVLDRLDGGSPKNQDACNVLSATVAATLTKREARVIEAELWFVHKAPDGKETSQRQAVRMRTSSRGDFYFDDMTLNANVGGRSEPLTVEVFGTLITGTMTPDGQMNIALQLTRRYINPKAIALGIPPTVGKGEYPMTIDAGDVVSFLLPPLENDRGAFLGHRFSVRLRIKPLVPDAN
jgi:hypothetical protein